MLKKIFGFTVETDYRFRTPMVETDGPSDLRFRCVRSENQENLDANSRLYASDHKNPFGESSVMLYRDAESEIMRFPRIADFVMNADSITCRLVDPEAEYLVEICLLGHVFGYFLERSGFSPVHGASVEVNGRATLFVADRTGGKSTLAASLLGAGLPLLADDISALEIRGDTILCRPGYPQIKLTPEQARTFGRGADGYEKVHPAYEKLNVPVSHLGEFRSTSLAAGCIYLLERSQDQNAPVRIETVSPGEAMKALLKNTFITEIIDATDLRVPRMRRLAHIVRTVPVKHLQYPSGYDHLPRVLESVRADIGG